jgi:hypothetical protein
MGEAVELCARSASRRPVVAGGHLPGRVHFALEDGDGGPSRWITLRALRVLLSGTCSDF